MSICVFPCCLNLASAQWMHHSFPSPHNRHLSLSAWSPLLCSILWFLHTYNGGNFFWTVVFFQPLLTFFIHLQKLLALHLSNEGPQHKFNRHVASRQLDGAGDGKEIGAPLPSCAMCCIRAHFPPPGLEDDFQLKGFHFTVEWETAGSYGDAKMMHPSCLDCMLLIWFCLGKINNI